MSSRSASDRCEYVLFRRHMFEKFVPTGHLPYGYDEILRCTSPRPIRTYILGYVVSVISECGKASIYFAHMARIVRSAMLQMRVTPEIKLATDHVLQRIGLNMTEAVELFFRRMIIDQRLPFDVAAVDNATYTQLLLDWQEETRTIALKREGHIQKTLKRSEVKRGGG